MKDSAAARVALVTGGSGGLCAGVGRRLLEAGWTVAVTERPGGSSALAGGGGPRAYAVDVADPEAFAACIERVATELGPIEVLVHGVGPMEIARFERAPMDAYRRMIDGNLTSAVVAAYGVLPAMRGAGFGRLIYFGMTGSSVTRPARGLAFYGAAKAGLVAFARTLAVEEAGRGITVNVIEPGDIRRKDLDREAAARLEARNPTGHAGSWEDVADAVRFLVSDDAAFVNGAVLAVGGGLTDASE